MRTPNFVRLAGVLLASIWLGGQVAPAGAADGDQYLGKWNGTYLGENASGHFELTLRRGADGALTGTIAVGEDGDSSSDYTASLKSASFVGDRFTASYEPPGGGQAEIILKGTFNAKGADGDWSLSAKNQPTATAASGTWKIIKP